MGPKRPQVAVALKGLAALYAAKGDLAQAGACESRANAVSEHDLALQLAVGSERQNLAYLALKANQVDQTISLRLRYAPQNPTAPDLAATLILQRKGRALDAASENLNSLRDRFDPEDHALLDQLTSTRSQLARLVFAGPRRMTAEQYWGRIKAPEDQTEKAETQVISL